MKKLNCLILALSFGLAGFAGCSKSDQPLPSPQVSGVTVDVPKLQQAFKGANPDVLNGVTQVSAGIRYGDYMKSLAALDKLASDPNITEAQKKVVNEVLEQVKQVVNSQAAKPPGQ